MSENYDQENTWWQKLLLNGAVWKIFIFSVLIVGFLFFIVNKTTTTKTKTKEEKVHLENGCDFDPTKFCLDIRSTAKEYGIDLSVEKNVSQTDWTDPNQNFTQQTLDTVLDTDLLLQSNGLTDKDKRKVILDQLSNEFRKDLLADKYTTENLNLSKDSSKDFIKKYFQKSFIPILNYQETIKNLSFDKDINPKSRKEKIISADEDLIKSLLEIEHSYGGANIAIKILNNLYHTNLFLLSSDIENIKDDPFKYVTFGGRDFLLEVNADLNKNFKDFYEYFLKNGVVDF